MLNEIYKVKSTMARKRDLIKISHKLIPMMNDDEICKVGVLLLEVMQRLGKEGRISEE